VVHQEREKTGSISYRSFGLRRQAEEKEEGLSYFGAVVGESERV